MSSLKPLFQTLAGLVETGKSTPEIVIRTLDLDMSAATLTKTRTGDFAIVDARRGTFPYAPSVGMFADARSRMIFLSLSDRDRIAYTDDLMAGFSVRIHRSKWTDGFSSAATLGITEIGCLVSGGDPHLEAISCEIRLPAAE